MLETYIKNGWKLLKIAPNGKNPINCSWTESVEDVGVEKVADWIAQGYNLGVLTGEVSGITVIDLDTDAIPRELAENMGDTLVQQTNKGYHFFFKYEKALPTTRIDALKIDILNNKRQCVIYPSRINGVERSWLDPENVLQPMPSSLRDWLLSHIKKVHDGAYLPVIPKIAEGTRNDTLVKLGGILRKELSPHQTEFVLNLINKRIIQNPLPQYEIDAMCKSLVSYINTDLHSLKERVLEYMAIVSIASINDLQRATREEPETLARVIYELQTDGYIIPYRKDYKFVCRPKWKTEFTGMGEPVNFKMPYFDDVAYFCYGDMILIGSQTGSGKTHIAVNILKQLVAQGMKPYYITTEAGSRFINIAEALHLKQGDFFWDTIVNVENVQLVPDSVTVLDWLMIEDKALTDKVFQLLQDQLFKSKGVLIVFQQLKDFSNEWFAPNLCKQFPVLAARYMRDKEDHTRGKFAIDKIREAKGKDYIREIPCLYNWATKELVQMETSATFAANAYKDEEEN